ncbi:MAG: leucine-rich repeat protein [Aristaeellaceae bacterium]
MKTRRFLLGMLLMTLLMLGASALAEDDVWVYDASNMYLWLKGEVSGEVSIPAEVDGCAVTALESGLFQNWSGITALTMPDTLRAMQSSAVCYMDGLTEVRLNDGLEYIGYGNFDNCAALTSVTVPASVRVVEASFRSCDSLKEIRFEGECPLFLSEEWCFNWLPEDCVIYVPDDQLDAYAAALANANGAARCLQPSGSNAEARPAENAEEWFSFDASTGTITGYTGSHAYLELPASIGGVAVKAIGAGAFRNDYSLYALVLPEGLERIEESAFQQACNLAYVSFPSTLRTIGDSGFMNAQISRIDWSEGLEEIGAQAFRYDKEEILCLPGTVRVIGDGAFENAWCQELYLGGNVERIGSRAFADSGLTYMAFDLYAPIDMASDAFVDTRVTDLDLPWDCSMENRDAYAAMLAGQCPECTVWINNPPGDVAADPISSTDVTVIENGVWTVYNGDQPDLTVWSDFDSVDVTALGDGVFKGNQSIRSFYPHHCGWFTTIGAEAFADSSVAYVELFPSITTIGDEAFRNCVNITDITLPESLTTLGDGAFRGCTGITELTLPSSLTSIGEGLLEGCTGLKKLTVLCDPALLPQDMAEVLAGVEELYAAPDATQEQVRALTALAGRAWYDPVPRVGEEPAQPASMPYAALSGDDFWYSEEDARLDDYLGWELNLYLPREIDGVQLTAIGGNLMSRACWGDNFDVELPVVSLVIPENYTELAMYAFRNCDTLETVICYAPVENLPEGLFSGCTSLREVVFVNGVRHIGRYVFDGCTSLETVYLGEYVESVSESAFLNTDDTEAFSLEQCITDVSLMPDVDALLSAVRCDPMPTPEPTATPAPAEPVGPEGEPYLGVWYGQTMEMDGGVLSLADYGIVLRLTFNEDGTMLLFDGEEEEASTWSVSSGIVQADTMQGALLSDGTLSLEEDGTKVIFVREEDADGAAPAAARPVGEEGEPFLGIWYAQTMEMDGSVYSMADFGLFMTLTFNEDGTVVSYDGEEEYTTAWTVSDGTALVDAMTLTLLPDGTLCLEDESGNVIFTRDSDAIAIASGVADARPVGEEGEPFLGDWYAQTIEMDGSVYSLSDIGLFMTLTFNEDGTVVVFDGEEEDTTAWSVSDGVALVEAMTLTLQPDGSLCLADESGNIIFTRDSDAISIATRVVETQPVGEEGEPFLGDWYAQTIEMDGSVYSLSDFGLSLTLTFNEDGTVVVFDGEEDDTAAWSVSDGEAWIDGYIMVVLQPDGSLCMEDMSGKFVFTRDNETPASGVVPSNGGEAGASGRMEVKYVLDTADVQGFTMTASMLGNMEYSLVFHADGTVDFVLSGTAVPGLSWTQQRVATEDGEADAYVIDYYGTPLNVILTEEGLDMNYFDSMLMHFVAE